MNVHWYERITSLVFALVACLHLARVIWHVEVHVDGVTVPMWLSWAGTLGAGFLSAWGIASARK